MGVIDGQAVSQAITNPAFINKNVDDVMPNKLGLNRVASGSSIADIQVAVNKLYTASGASESQSGTVYNAPSNTISNGDPYQTALTKLADKFDPATGHMHTGAAGDAPPISGGHITGVPLLGFLEAGSTIVGATGTQTNVTSLMIGKVPSSNSTTLGVVVDTSHNKVRVLAASGSGAYQEIVDSGGNLVYGRITATAPTGGTWNLGYFSEQSGVETSYSFATATNLFWWYQELFNPVLSTSVYNPTMEMFAPISGGAVTSIAVSGGAPLTGSVTLSAGSGVSLSEVGQNIQIAATGNVSSIAASGSTQLTGNVTLSAGPGITLSEVGQNIQISSTGVGGGGSLSWIEGVNSATPLFENNIEVYGFDKGLSQALYTSIKVPNSYSSGSPIKLRSEFYSPDSSGTVLFQTIATLIRTGTDTISSVTNQRTSTNSAVILGAGTVNIPQAVTFDLTDSTGKINGVSVSANDTLIVELLRGTDSATSTARQMVFASEVTFT